MRAIRIAGLVLLGGLTLAACSDDDDPRPLEPTVRSDARIAPECDLRDAKSDARSFFDPRSDRRKEALNNIDQMEQHCAMGVGGAEALDGAAWRVVELVEETVESRNATENGAYASTGADLVQAMLACTAAGGSCLGDSTLPAELTGLLPAALGPLGLFAVVDGTGPVFARVAVPFVDRHDQNNHVLWALRNPGNSAWPGVVLKSGDGPVLFYGAPAGDDLDLQEEHPGVPQYELHVYPEKDTDTQISVVACFALGVDSHPEDQEHIELVPRIQREETILQGADAGCDALWTAYGGNPALSNGVQQASLWGSFARLLPRPLLAMFSDRTVGGVAGDLTNFSRFAPVIASGQLHLVFDDIPSDMDGKREVVGQSFTVKVLATTGNGTPVEAVEVELYIAGNRGAGATFDGEDNPTELHATTDEEHGIATFDAALEQPGGYILCARGALADFSVTEVCSELFHVNNDTGS